jgi:hypothetical protein
MSIMRKFKERFNFVPVKVKRLEEGAWTAE